MTNNQSPHISARQLWFTSLRQVEVRSQSLSSLQPDEVLVQTHCSAISAGTELLVYRGQVPADVALDSSIEALQQASGYPLQYGYACVGVVTHCGRDIDAGWLHKRVFAFQPHSSHFITTPAQLIPIPDDISLEQAVFLANMETAVNLVQDGNPAIGEQIVVLGLGVVGLLVAGLLAQFPLKNLIAIDAIAARRNQALAWGAISAIDPFDQISINHARQQLAASSCAGADLVYEITGTPEALNLAIEFSGFASRIVIGSWYGNKTAAIHLGGEAHRNRISITTSQVSSIAPKLSGRWDKARRFEVVWDMIRKLNPQRLITHRMSLENAADIYQMLDQTPDEIIQAVFVYPDI